MIVNGTTYCDDTNPEVIKWLETSRERKQRIRIFYGNDKHAYNGCSIIGIVGRSSGSIKIPIFLKFELSLGGGAILVDHIARIDTKNIRGTIVTVYKKSSVQFDHYITDGGKNVLNETNGLQFSTCKSAACAVRLAAYLNGKRWSK
jgi:hypothetical protein